MKYTLLLLMFIQTVSFSKSTTERIGDVLTLLVPSLAFSATLISDDTQGQIEFLKATASTAALTHLLKYTVRAPRPNNSDSITSFPSGHTSSAFSGASFIHKKYGFSYAVPAYIGAIYTAYSRVHANKHYTKDVIAGAVLGIGFSWYFVTPYKDLSLTPTVNNNTYGVQLNYKY